MFDFSNTRIDFRRPVSSYSKVRTAVGLVVRNRIIFANKKAKDCYLDLGCGSNLNADFCNLDFEWRPGVDVRWDVTRGLPFANRYIGGIFTEHMLEHITFSAALVLLIECRRVLRLGGTMRIVVPDGELYLSEYARHSAGGIARMPYAEDDKSSFSFVTPMVSINRIFRFHGHQFIWDYETLRLSSIRAGFTNVEKRQFGDGADQKLLRDTENRKIESLYVEAS